MVLVRKINGGFVVEDEQERLCWLGLHTTPGIGSRRTLALVAHFGSAREAWQAKPEQLQNARILDTSTCQALLQRRTRTNLAALALAWRKRGIYFCTVRDAEYPAPLTSLYDPPAVLYYRGHLPTWTKTIAVVGARHCSSAGRKAAFQLAAALAAAGVVVVSGAARGIDTAAHQGALTQGITAAVLGCGVDVVYPPENGALLQEITHRGAVISEYPPGTRPAPGHFPMRNRLISGLAQGVLIVEAGEKSGALITADCALEQGRDVFAVPGNIFVPQSQGTNNLIKQGAKLVDRVEDILAEYGWPERPKPAVPPVALSAEERLVYENLLPDAPLTLEEVIQRTELPASQAAGTLLQLELKGLILQQPGQQYMRLTREVE